MGNIVKKQHYVWREYLSKWTDTGDNYKGKVFVLRKNPKGNQEKIEYRELEKVGFEKFFYDVTGFTEKDVKIVLQLIERLQDKELMKFGLSKDALNEAAISRDFIEKNAMCVAENIENQHKFFEKIEQGDLSFYEDSPNQISLEKFEKSLIESVLYGEQITFSQMVDLISDFSFEPSVDKKYEFNYFFCMQYFRSPRIRENFEENTKELKKQYSDLDINIPFFTNMIALYFAERVALNLSQNFCCNLLLYKNNTTSKFITGDTPIVCITGTQMKEKSVFHYPITPEMSLELIVMRKDLNLNKGKNEIVELSDENVDVVKNLNKILAGNCVNEVYAKEKDDFIDLE